MVLGHVMRRGKLEHLVTTGKFEGKRSRGRQREKIMDGLATWLGIGKVSDTLDAAKDRDLWRDMIANAYKAATPAPTVICNAHSPSNSEPKTVSVDNVKKTEKMHSDVKLFRDLIADN
ncbi:hypothetical protein PoB_006317700 [Plakobranchus ocellatus]|uniref:Uncharacterized protein n=1 Tax=Plakobranchus ocellatus TaxID=259542 RepID=A0AAV4CXN5_9GAST|nr:hypothetical protein PoB_006317700 [Plakobranchus ocellatus]